MWGSGIYSAGEYDAYLVYFVVVPLVVQIRTIRSSIGHPGNEMYFFVTERVFLHLSADIRESLYSGSRRH